MAKFKKVKVKKIGKGKPQRFRFRKLKPTKKFERKQRLGFKNNRVVEIAEFRKAK